MAKIVGLPKLSPTMEEGTLASWAKKEGDEIAVDDLIAEVETDKATMEWRAFDPGVLLKILVPEGTVLEPDAPVAIFGQAGEDISDLLAQLEAGGGSGKKDSGADDSERAAEDGGGSGRDEASGASSTKGSSPRASSAEVDGSRDGAGASAGARTADGRVLASPAVRRVAREKDIDLEAIAGSGPRGRIILRDLEGRSFSSSRAASSSGERLPPRTEKLSSMRRTIARRLTESKQTVPHFYLTVDLDAGPLMAARKMINQDLEAAGEKVSVNDLVLKAAAVALRRFPDANASFGGDHIAYHQVVDISVAVAIPDGLVTPVIRDADRLGVGEIARRVRELAERARNKKLTPEEMTGGTFSVSNLGMYGITEFSAVINPPEGCILAVGAVRSEPVVEGERIVPGKRMKVTLSCDHRVVDGAIGAQWLQVFRKLIEQPILLTV